MKLTFGVPKLRSATIRVPNMQFSPSYDVACQIEVFFLSVPYPIAQSFPVKCIFICTILGNWHTFLTSLTLQLASKLPTNRDNNLFLIKFPSSIYMWLWLFTIGLLQL
jgi:hypothetical protein